MLSSLDILYLVLAFCAIVVTCVLVALGMELIRVVREMRQISHNVEEITVLLERVSQIVFPGIERLARGAERMEGKVSRFLQKKVEKLTKE